MTERRGRGRPRQFDPGDAMEAALETFRAHGYSGTSIEDLAAATNLSRPSLYAAFGNKKALFEACLERYWAGTAERCGAALRSGGTLRDDLRAFFAAYLDRTCSGPVRGCLVLCALPTEIERDPSLRLRLEKVLRQSDAAVTARLAAARAAGELPADADPEALGAVVVSVMTALSLRARAGAPRERLERIARQTAALIDAAAGVAPKRRRAVGRRRGRR